jgi:hypothetical protein
MTDGIVKVNRKEVQSMGWQTAKAERKKLGRGRSSEKPEEAASCLSPQNLAVWSEQPTCSVKPRHRQVSTTDSHPQI